MFFCVDCLEEDISHAASAERRALVLQAVALARRAIDPSDSSVATRELLRRRLGRLAELGRESVPNLAAELGLIAAAPAPALP